MAETALTANRALLQSPSRPALDRYTGVLYAALAVPTMSSTVRAAAEERVLVWSGLFGLLRGGDAVPDYRVPVAAVLPRLGALTPVWRSAIRTSVPAVLGREFAVDLRSTDYAAMWAPTGPLRNQVLPVRVLTARPDGVSRIVSHRSKHGKGELARALLEVSANGTRIDDVFDVAAVVEDMGWRSEVRRVVGGSPALDVIAPEPT